jgi:hypothetical protein
VQFAPHYSDPFRDSDAVHRNFNMQEAFMGKLAIFLGGFLVVTILIGVLATISPV